MMKDRIKKAFLGTGLLLSMAPGVTSCASTNTNDNEESKQEYTVENADQLLIAAAKKNDLETLKEAIEAGADVNAQDPESGRTALMFLHDRLSYVIEYREPYGEEQLKQFEMIHYLLNHKDIDLSVPDYTGAQYIHHVNAHIEHHDVHGGKKMHPGELVIKEIVEQKMAEREKTNTQNKTYHFMNYANNSRAG